MVLTLTKNLQHKIFHQYSVLALYNICIRSKDHTWLSAPWPNQWLVTAWRILHCRRWDIGSGTRSSKPWFPWRACWKSCSSVSFSAGVFSFWGPLTFWLVGNVADELSLQLGRYQLNSGRCEFFCSQFAARCPHYRTGRKGVCHRRQKRTVGESSMKEVEALRQRQLF